MRAGVLHCEIDVRLASVGLPNVIAPRPDEMNSIRGGERLRDRGRDARRLALRQKRQDMGGVGLWAMLHTGNSGVPNALLVGGSVAAMSRGSAVERIQ